MRKAKRQFKIDEDFEKLEEEQDRFWRETEQEREHKERRRRMRQGDFL